MHTIFTPGVADDSIISQCIFEDLVEVRELRIGVSGFIDNFMNDIYIIFGRIHDSVQGLTHCPRYSVVFCIRPIGNDVISDFGRKSIQKLVDLRPCNCDGFFTQRLPNVQINLIQTASILVVLCHFSVVREIESFPLGCSRGSKLGIVEYSERIRAPVVNNLRCSVFVHNLACPCRVVLPVSKPALKLLRICYVFHSCIDRASGIAYTMNVAVGGKQATGELDPGPLE